MLMQSGIFVYRIIYNYLKDLVSTTGPLYFSIFQKSKKTFLLGIDLQIIE